MIISYNFIKITFSFILESPEDITVVIGDPATLICRVDNEDVKWFKDGMEMNIDDDEEIFILPDGSLFFLSPRLEDTALYNCGYEEDDGDIVSSRPAAIIVVTDRDFNMNIKVEYITDNYFEINLSKIKLNEAKEYKSPERNIIYSEYLEEDIPRKVYIISMIIVGTMTVVIIAGAAFTFRKIKDLLREQTSEDSVENGEEGQTPTMVKIQYSDFHCTTGNTQQYKTPIKIQQKVPEDIIPLRYGHSIQPYKAYQDKQYGKLKPVYLLPKDMLHSVI